MIIYTMFMVHVYLEQLMVMLRDGRTLIAFLRSLDQFGMFISFPNKNYRSISWDPVTNKLIDIYLRIIF